MKIDLAKLGLRDAGAAKLGDALIKFSKHKVSKTQRAILAMEDEDMDEYFRNATTALCLFEIDVSSNGIGPDGAAAIAKAVRRNRGIVALDFRSNELGEDGAESLAQATRHRAAVAGVVRGAPHVKEVLLAGNPGLTRDFCAACFGLAYGAGERGDETNNANLAPAIERSGGGGDGESEDGPEWPDAVDAILVGGAP